MLINAKTVAFGGLMLALTEVCIALGSVIETNTLFLLAAASYLVGIVIRETNLRIGSGFWLAGVILGILIAPNKFYVFSYAAMGLYILLIEIAWNQIGKMQEKVPRMKVFWCMKFLMFNLIYITTLFVGKELLFVGDISWKAIILFLIAGQIGFIIYDKAYEYVQRQIWSKVRGRLM